MSRLAFFILAASFLAVGCAHKNPDPQAVMPPPGWNAAPPPGAVVAPAPSGCSSCGANNPVVNAPRYSPPVPAAPPLTSSNPAPVVTAPANPALATSNKPAYNMGPIQAAFTPTVLPIESGRLGAIQIDDSPTIPTPPSDQPDALSTSNPTKS